MHNDPDIIKHEIDAIQARMKKRAENLGNQLSPNRLVSETMEGFLSHPGKTVDQLVATMRNHPLASAMTAAGIISIVGAASRDSVAHAYGNSRAAEKVGEGMDKAKQKARTVAKSSADAVNTLSESVSEAQERVRSTAKSAAASVSGAGQDAVNRTRDLASETKRFAEDNPVALGLFAVGIGALAAAIFTARRSDASTGDEPAKATAKPKVSQAKKATRAKSQRNKTVRKMKPARGTAKAGTTRTGTAKSKAASATNTDKVAVRAPNPTTRGNAQAAGRTGSDAGGERTAALADVNGPRNK